MAELCSTRQTKRLSLVKSNEAIVTVGATAAAKRRSTAASTLSFRSTYQLGHLFGFAAAASTRVASAVAASAVDEAVDWALPSIARAFPALGLVASVLLVLFKTSV